jgi:DNA modification methylase
MFGDAGLNYYWMDAQLNEGQTAMVHARRVFAKWKPILIYQNPPFKINDQTFYDVIHSDREKAEHEWQQSTGDLEQIIPRFSHPGDLLVEPFAGSGTTITVAKRYGLRWIACERDPHTYEVAKCRQIRESLFEEF